MPLPDDTQRAIEEAVKFANNANNAFYTPFVPFKPAVDFGKNLGGYWGRYLAENYGDAFANWWGQQGFEIPAWLENAPGWLETVFNQHFSNWQATQPPAQVAPQTTVVGTTPAPMGIGYPSGVAPAPVSAPVVVIPPPPPKIEYNQDYGAWSVDGELQGTYNNWGQPVGTPGPYGQKGGKQHNRHGSAISASQTSASVTQRIQQVKTQQWQAKTRQVEARKGNPKY